MISFAEGQKFTLRGFLGYFEAMSGLVMLCVVILLGVGIGGFIAMFGAFSDKALRSVLDVRLGISLAWLITLGFGLRCCRRYMGDDGAVAGHPLALVFALNRRPAPWRLLRPIIAVWWWLMGLWGLVAAMVIGVVISLKSPDFVERIAIEAIHLAAHAAGAVSMNTCLLIGVYHLTHSESATRIVSKVRFFIDLVAACVSIVASPILAHFLRSL